jgi:type IX secretion system PorP/SprF family membrane protein
MKIFTKIVFTVLSFLALADLYGQDPTFSQFDANQLYYNPAYAGYKLDGRVEMIYRNLWPNVRGESFPGPLSTYSAFGDAYFNIHNRFSGGAGAFAMQDVEGEGFLTTTSAGIMYSQHMPHIKGKNDRQDRFNIYIGFKAYYNHIHVDWSRFVFSDQLNANYGITGPSSFTQNSISNRDYFDFDYGVLIRNNYKARGKWYNEIGFAMAHVLAPTIAITGSNSDQDRLPRKYTLTYRGNVAVQGDNFFIGPTILMESQAKFFEANAGMDVYFKLGNKHETIPLSLGIYDRFSFIVRNSETGQEKINTSAIVVAVTHRGNLPTGMNPLGYSVGFSVDFPYMGLGMQTAGAYEVTMGLQIPYKKSNKMKCPFEAF